jgi:sphinganine-1-phosphate aldolase
MDFINKIIQNTPVVGRLLIRTGDVIDARFKDQTPTKLIAVTIGSTVVAYRLYQYYLDIDTDVATHFKRVFFRLARKISFLNTKINNELDKTRKGLEAEIFKANKGIDYIRALPKVGLNDVDLEAIINSYCQMSDTKWREGAVSGCVYADNLDELTELTTQVYKKFSWSNVMHADVFPDARKMEAEVVRMVLDMYNGDDNTCGTMTSGGTESIMLACRAYRDLARERGVKRPEMIVPDTAHAAFDKAGQYFGIRVIHVPVNPNTRRADPKKMKKYINGNTCMLVASAPSFAHGPIDPISEIAALGVKYNIPVHVDACLGGFVLPFMDEAGFPTAPFDFRVPGVTSISCDTHKYGYTPKGSSVIMYRNRELRHYQFFSAAEWQGGIYVSPTFAGSRPGSLIAMTWATLLHFGRQGYVEATRDIVRTTRYIADEIRKIPELRLMAEPDTSVVAFDSKEFNIYNLVDELKEWHLNGIQNPSGVHIAVTKLHTKPGVAERFVEDIKKAVRAIMKQDDRQLGKTAQLYCTTQSVPDKSLISQVSFLYLDACYSTNLSAE